MLGAPKLLVGWDSLRLAAPLMPCRGAWRAVRCWQCASQLLRQVATECRLPSQGASPFGPCSIPVTRHWLDVRPVAGCVPWCQTVVHTLRCGFSNAPQHRRRYSIVRRGDVAGASSRHAGCPPCADSELGRAHSKKNHNAECRGRVCDKFEVRRMRNMLRLALSAKEQHGKACLCPTLWILMLRTLVLARCDQDSYAH